ncbi:MAG: hypothetical protein ACI9JY_002991, partial [Saprospiraceae bacterium]
MCGVREGDFLIKNVELRILGRTYAVFWYKSLLDPTKNIFNNMNEFF